MLLTLELYVCTPFSGCEMWFNALHFGIFIYFPVWMAIEWKEVKTLITVLA